MNHIEIERKFLVKGDFMPFVSNRFTIKQGYILASSEKTVRIRVKDRQGFITIKGEANENGFSRFEWEQEIMLDDAERLLELCDDFVIDKTRYEVIFEGKKFEVDVFHGLHDGLILAELELQSENEPYVAPSWLGKEVTGDVRYYNAWLSKNAAIK
ncbi:MAG: CYTH domain-containing protein [Paludibacteraceae bacterium]